MAPSVTMVLKARRVRARGAFDQIATGTFGE
jgi:hypothetical protein